MTYGGRTWLRSTCPATLARKPGTGRIDGVVGGSDRTTSVPIPGLAPTAVDGACAWSARKGNVGVELNRERRFTIRTGSTNGAPAADPGPDRRGRLGPVALDGRASCDPDGHALRYAWQITSAPAGSAWKLDRPHTSTPALEVDRLGTYRVRLVVTDERGKRSSAREVVIQVGNPCRSFEHQGDLRCEP